MIYHLTVNHKRNIKWISSNSILLSHKHPYRILILNEKRIKVQMQQEKATRSWSNAEWIHKSCKGI